PGFLKLLNQLPAPCSLTLLNPKSPPDDDRQSQRVLVLVGERNETVVAAGHEKAEFRSQKSE
ncbi:MAG: hypothetical protein ACREB3_01105, partial [Burkholderiales bacterium]